MQQIYFDLQNSVPMHTSLCVFVFLSPHVNKHTHTNTFRRIFIKEPKYASI